MSAVIKVENLSKRYIIGHQKQERYSALRDVIADGAKGVGRKLLNSVSRKNSLNRDATREEFWALKDIDFEIHQGDRVGIIGRNGAGKSTLLKILSRITEPTTGKVSMNGRVASLLEVGTGFHPELTGRENIFLNAVILGMKKSEIKRKFDEIVEFAEVEKFLDTPVKRYSSGMYVRLAFSVAAHLEPDILVVDEVLAVGDFAFQKKCLGRMSELGKSGRTVLFVSHNMSAVKQLCERAILLNNGRIDSDGNSEDVVNYYMSSSSPNITSSIDYQRDQNKNVAQIRHISVTRDDNLNQTFDLKDNITINVHYEFYKDVAGISVGLQIIDSVSGTIILSLPDPELDYSRLGSRDKGYYKARVVVPGNLLNTSTYSVKVGISRKNQIYDVSTDVNFEVIDTIGIVSPLGNERKNSVLSMQLPWTIDSQASNPVL